MISFSMWPCQDERCVPHRFAADGYVDMSVKNFNSWHQGSIDPSKIGFFLTTSEAEAQLEVDLSQVLTPSLTC